MEYSNKMGLKNTFLRIKYYTILYKLNTDKKIFNNFFLLIIFFWLFKIGFKMEFDNYT